ncbi:putative diphthamide synthesis domain containing protein [Amanita muscaria]
MAESKTSASKPRKRFVGSKAAKSSNQSTFSNQIPDEIVHDERLNRAISQLPSNYSFEIHKTIHHIRKNNATAVALQMPEGLQMFACTVSDIIEQFTGATTVILGDVTYGACCVDDYTALALGCDMMVHYGHSCLVPIDQTRIKTLYVFVEISIDSSHLEKTIRFNLPTDRQHFRDLILRSEEDSRSTGLDHLRIEEPSCGRLPEITGEGVSVNPEPTKLALVSTIQFVAALQRLKEDLAAYSNSNQSTSLLLETPTHLVSDEESSQQRRYWTGNYDVTIPRSKPLSPGEILGCTAPRLGDVDAILYLGDGRFHLEAIMIANPSVPAFRYDPYAKKLTRERYNYSEMQLMRSEAVESARKDTSLSRGESYSVWGVILGTLGRQGNYNQLEAITKPLKSASSAVPHIEILMSEISPAKLSLFHPWVSVFVQTSCPRLSIDWGYAFDRPLLSPYETAVAFREVKGWADKDEKEGGVYAMDFYEGGSPWSLARSTGDLMVNRRI